uniref:Chitin-binding type-2 domain-containing protein n=2 Tax=Clytia hemisphaerica TaxID=252671 RepID=A0A7M5UZI8_9CNID
FSQISDLINLHKVQNPNKIHKPHDDPDCPSSLCHHKDSGIFALKEHSNIFVQCSNGKAFCRKCPRGLIFSDFSKTCIRQSHKTTISTTTTTTTTNWPPLHYNPYKTHIRPHTTKSTKAPHDLFRGIKLHKFHKPHTTKVPHVPHSDCPTSLCAHKVDGSLFRLNDHQPNIFVQCSHGKPVCKKCPEHQFFNDKFNVCVRRTIPHTTTKKSHVSVVGHHKTLRNNFSR